MKICIIGSIPFQYKIRQIFNNRFVKLVHFTNPFEALKKLRKLTEWNLIIIEKELKVISSQSLELLIKETTKLKNLHIISSDSPQLTLQKPSQKQIKKHKTKTQSIKYNCQTSQLHINKKIFNLHEKEWRILEFLLQHRDMTISKESIIKAIWGQKLLHSKKSIYANLYSLKKKLKNSKIQIQNIHGHGYKLTDK